MKPKKIMNLLKSYLFMAGLILLYIIVIFTAFTIISICVGLSILVIIFGYKILLLILF